MADRLIGLAVRDDVVARMCELVADGKLSDAEFALRLDRAHRAVDDADLQAMALDAPETRFSRALRATRRAQRRAARHQPLPPPVAAKTPAPTAKPAQRLIKVDSTHDSIAVVGRVVRRGAWNVRRVNRVFVGVGGAELDFRDATLPPGVTDLEIIILIGGCELIVPPTLAVDCQGTALVGAFAGDGQQPQLASPETPRLRVRGFVGVGGLEVKVRLPGESRWQARLRVAKERRAKR